MLVWYIQCKEYMQVAFYFCLLTFGKVSTNFLCNGSFLRSGEGENLGWEGELVLGRWYPQPHWLQPNSKPYHWTSLWCIRLSFNGRNIFVGTPRYGLNLKTYWIATVTNKQEKSNWRFVEIICDNAFRCSDNILYNFCEKFWFWCVI